MQSLFSSLRSRRWMLPLAVGLVVLSAIGIMLYWRSASARTSTYSRTIHRPGDAANGAKPKTTDAGESPPANAVVTLSRAQQEAIGLKVVTVTTGAATDEVVGTAQVVPDESKFAYITPRAAGVVRNVAAHVGQNVRAGDLLALIDSPNVSQARFDLATRLQELEIARTQAEWQETIFNNTLALVERLKAGDSPEQIHQGFENRPVGANREQLLTAYADYRLARATLDRNQELIADKVITPKQFQQVLAGFESAQARYQALMDQMDFTNRQAHILAQQALRRAETAMRVARERLRVLGVRPDGTEPEIKHGHVVGVRRDGILPPQPGHEAPDSTRPEEILPESAKGEAVPVTPVGAPADGDRPESAKDLPISTYALWAPFDGTVLDRELIVPGVFVDTTHRIFTLADLSTVWIEVAIHESHYGALSRSGGAGLSLTSNAYPGRSFDAEVIYTGDLVDQKTRSIKLLARAQNPDRLLKPGMFGMVTLHLKGTRPALLVPADATVTEDDHTLVFVQTGPERFERRRVVTGAADDGQIAILDGLAPGDRVVVAGGFKLKSKAIQVLREGP